MMLKRKKGEKTMNMTPAEVTAVNKAIKKAALDKARAELGVGVHDISVTVTVDGTITVGEDYDQEFWQIAKPEKTVLALACALNKTTADKITQEQYDRVLADVDGIVNEITDDQAKRFKAEREKVLKTLRAPTKKTARGKVTTKLAIEKINTASENAT